MIFARRSRCLSVSWRYLTKPLSLDSHATSWDLFPPRRSSLRVQRWSALENPPPRSRLVPVLRSLTWSLSTSPVMMSLDSGFPVRIYWLALYLELLRRGIGFSYLRRKDKEKRFPESSSPLPRASLLFPRRHVEEISIMIGLHVPLRRKSPGDISLRFFWLCWYSSTTSAYTLSTNCVWTLIPQCNPPDNVHPCTPKIRDVRRTLFQPRDSPGVWSVRSWSARDDAPVPGPGVSANENWSQVLRTYLKLWHRHRTRAVWRQVSPVWYSW